MIAKELISSSIPPLVDNDQVGKALNWMKEFHVEHLPIINGPLYKGILSEDDLIDLENGDGTIAELDVKFNRPFVLAHEHIYEVIKKISENKLSILPVLGDAEAYLGVISLESLIQNYSNISAVKNPGGILTLEMAQNNYSLAEIARIVESNNAMILNSTVNGQPNSSQIEVTLKINKQDLTAIIGTFERFEYTIKQAYQESAFDDMLKDRYDALMNYLDI